MCGGRSRPGRAGTGVAAVELQVEGERAELVELVAQVQRAQPFEHATPGEGERVLGRVAAQLDARHLGAADGSGRAKHALGGGQEGREGDSRRGEPAWIVEQRYPHGRLLERAPRRVLHIEFFDRRARDWREQRARILRDLANVEVADEGALRLGLELFEGLRHLPDRYAASEMGNKHSLVICTRSHAIWRGDHLDVTL